MALHEQILETLKETGYRLTPQRVMILNVIAQGQGHISAEEILAQVRRQYPYIDMTTVYRTLHLLKQLHLLTEIELEGASRYELAQPNKHHHMVCRSCGNAFDLSPSYLEEFRGALVREFGFQPDLEHFTVSGVCAECNRPKATTTGTVSSRTPTEGR